jgi:CRP-like cAMP-binding protein
LDAYPHVLRSIAVGLAKRVRVNTEQIADMGLFDTPGRVARHVWRTFVRDANGEPAIGQRVRLNQTEAASIVGAARESVNKELHALREQGIIDIDGQNLVLVDPERLRARVPIV